MINAKAPVKHDRSKYPNGSQQSANVKPEFVLLAEKEKQLLKVHHEFSNEFDPSDKLTKRAESNLHQISFKPPALGTSRPGVVNKAA